MHISTHHAATNNKKLGQLQLKVLNMKNRDEHLRSHGMGVGSCHNEHVNITYTCTLKIDKLFSRLLMKCDV